MNHALMEMYKKEEENRMQSNDVANAQGQAYADNARERFLENEARTSYERQKREENNLTRKAMIKEMVNNKKKYQLIKSPNISICFNNIVFMMESLCDDNIIIDIKEVDINSIVPKHYKEYIELETTTIKELCSNYSLAYFYNSFLGRWRFIEVSFSGWEKSFNREYDLGDINKQYNKNYVLKGE
ncbi:MAG: hypothetical protein GY679_01575 [Mycoplasma sp.]|nr:hypothetical protein [Mycoplasma sp.]